MIDVLKKIKRFFAEKYGQEAILLLIALLGVLILSDSCVDQSTLSNERPSKQARTPIPSAGVQSKETTISNLSPYPRGWIPGTEGWSPPLPPGLGEPRILTQDEWNKVIAIARTDQEVTTQAENNNIGDLIRFWVGYAGGPGIYVETDSNIISGKVRAPEGNWYYPAIRFLYVSRTDRNAQLVLCNSNSFTYMY